MTDEGLDMWRESASRWTQNRRCCQVSTRAL